MITYTKGDLLLDDAEILVNTVNTVGVMGRGIALAFKTAFPHNFEVYRLACKSGRCQTGSLITVEDHNLLYGRKLIVNLPTKTDWRRPSAYIYIEAGLKALKILLETAPGKRLAIPALGCGNGGLEWNEIKALIEDILGGLDTDIRVYLPETA